VKNGAPRAPAENANSPVGDRIKQSALAHRPAPGIGRLGHLACVRAIDRRSKRRALACIARMSGSDAHVENRGMRCVGKRRPHSVDRRGRDGRVLCARTRRSALPNRSGAEATDRPCRGTLLHHATDHERRLYKRSRTTPGDTLDVRSTSGSAARPSSEVCWHRCSIGGTPTCKGICHRNVQGRAGARACEPKFRSRPAGVCNAARRPLDRRITTTSYALVAGICVPRSETPCPSAT